MPRKNAAQTFALSLKLGLDTLHNKLAKHLDSSVALESLVKEVEQQSARLLNLLNKAEESFASHDANADLSESGRKRLMAQTAVPLLGDIAHFKKEVAGTYGSSFHTMSNLLLKKAAPERPIDSGERLAYELRLQEIRNSIRSFDPVTRINMYFGQTNPEVIDAFETAPPSPVRTDRGVVLLPFIDEGLKNMAITSRAKRMDPDMARKMETADLLRSFFSNLADEAARAVEEVAPTTVRDEVAEMAGA